MIQDRMIEEIQELKLAGYTVREAYDTLRARHNKVPTLKTVRKYYNMDRVPEDSHARERKQAAFDVEPLASAIVEILERNPGCYMSSVYDVLVERFVETGEMDALPGNEQTLRNYIRRLREEGKIEEGPDSRRRYDVVDVPEPGRMAQVDFGQQDCGGGLVVHFMCVLLWYSRLLGVYAQDHRFNSEESCRALHRFSCKCGGRVRTYVIDQDSVFVSEEVYGEVFETATPPQRLLRLPAIRVHVRVFRDVRERCRGGAVMARVNLSNEHHGTVWVCQTTTFDEGEGSEWDSFATHAAFAMHTEAIMWASRLESE